MLQDNFLLLQVVKKKFQSKRLHVEGIVKSTEKNFGFLEVSTKKKYFIPPLQMKRVMHGDRITAVLSTEEGYEFVKPEKLIEPSLTRFIGRILRKQNNGFLSILPNHPLLKNIIPCCIRQGISHTFKEGDWAVAEMRYHPLRNDREFYAELIEFIACNDDCFVPWLVTLSRYNLEKSAPNDVDIEILQEGLKRRDLTALNFFTIDNENTEDIDDALYIEKNNDGKLCLTVAIADPTAWISEGSKLDVIAKVRSFTNYLPGFNIPMLPREFSNNLCSLQEKRIRPVLACRMILESDGSIVDEVEFFAAIIESKAKLTYDQVSNWQENIGDWKPENDVIAQQIHLLNQMYLSRYRWRYNHALIFKDRQRYRFIFGKNNKLLDVISEPRRSANCIVEEAMIAANMSAANILSNKLGFGIYNTHKGFDPIHVEALVSVLKAHDLHVDPEEILTLTGFCKLRRKLNEMPSGFLANYVRRFQLFPKISTKPDSHFGLGLKVYATWTSPIRKYGDMVNHRLLKAVIKGEETSCPKEEITMQITERRRLNRIAERDVSNWLYANFMSDKAGTNIRFKVEIIDINRSGVRARLISNGAMTFIPSVFLHTVRNELVCNQENGIVQIKGKTIYKITDVIDVTIVEVRMNNHSIIARPISKF